MGKKEPEEFKKDLTLGKGTGKLYKVELKDTIKVKDTLTITGKAKSWKEVLNEIYNSLPSQYGRGKEGISDNHSLAKKLKISGFELTQCLMFLSDQGLIEYRNGNWINLTKKGFDVALENEKHIINLRLQFTIAIFTIFLVITTIFDFFYSLGLYDPLNLLFIYVAMLLIVFFIVKRKGK